MGQIYTINLLPALVRRCAACHTYKFIRWPSPPHIASRLPARSYPRWVRVNLQRIMTNFSRADRNHSSRHLICRKIASVVLLIAMVFLSGGSIYAQTKPDAGLPDGPAPQTAKLGFFAKLAKFYREDWHGTAPSSPAPPRRGLPSPLQSPPFPNSDWSYGGSPVLGEPDTNSYPLMTAWNDARSRTKVYGWVEPSGNGSTSTHSNSP